MSGPTSVDGIGDSTQFTSGASETNWPWSPAQTSGVNTAGDKNDINNVYAMQRTVGTHVYAFLGFERATGNGTAQLVVELNALANSPSGSPTPQRSTGDLRLLVNQGGQNDLVLTRADVWTSTSATTGSWSALSNLASFKGTANNGVITNFAGTSNLDKGLFAEFAIDLTALFGESDCSGNYGILNVRSSASGDSSSLKDWVKPIALNIPSTCSSVVVDKKWDIDGQKYDDGQQPEGFDVNLTLSGQNNPQFGTEYSSKSDDERYKSGDSITVGEFGLKLPEGCVNVVSGDEGTHTLSVGKNAYTLTNTVTCTQLTLIKKVVGEAAATSWTLSATGPTPLSGISGSPAVTKASVKAGTYTLSESAGPSDYKLTNIDCGAENPVSDSAQVTLTTGDKVVCTLTNTAQIALTVTKKWIVNGEEFAHGEQPVGQAQLLVGEAEEDFGATITGYLVGDEVEIAESVSDLPELCTVSTTIDGTEAQKITHTLSSTPDPNVVEVINTVKCVQELTLIKKLDNDDFAGTSVVSDWTLTAQNTQDESIKAQGVTGQPEVTAAHVPTGSYSLSEAGPEGYEAGAWTCSGTGEFVDGTLALDLGQAATCTIVNTAKAGSVQWNKTDARGRLLAGASWELSGPTGDNSQTVEITDCTDDPCSGPDRDATGGKFSIENLAWGDYTLTETLAPPGYQRDTQTHEFTVQGDELQVELAAVVNEQQAGPSLPLTGGIGRDHVYLLGGSILILGLCALGGRFWKLRHNRKVR